MYLFARGARFGPGHAQEEMGWAIAMTEKVNQISETKVSLWTTFMSPGVNTLYWTTFAEDLATFEAANDKFMTDSGYLMLLEQGARYVTAEPINDVIMQVVHGTTDVNHQPAYVAEVAATVANGNAVRGIELGVEIATTAEALTKAPTTFSVASTGIYGAVAWHTAFDSITELQRGQEALLDMSFLEQIDKKAKDVYQPAATQTIYRRIM